MVMKERILRLLKENELTVKQITELLNEKYQINTNENNIRVYVNRLIQDNLIEKCGYSNRYKIYKLSSYLKPDIKLFRCLMRTEL